MWAVCETQISTFTQQRRSPVKYAVVLVFAGLAWFVSPMLTFVILFSLFDANVELQLEVDYQNPQPGTGWSLNLNCWKTMDAGKWYYKIWKTIMGPVKPMTGYHTWRIPMILLLFHLPFFMGLEWSGRRELNTWFWFLLQGTVEDYLWFFFHPCYGPKKFISEGRAGKIWWMPTFWGPIPKDYYMGIPPLAILKVLTFFV